jgi:hypothetical protein
MRFHIFAKSSGRLGSIDRAGRLPLCLAVAWLAAVPHAFAQDIRCPFEEHPAFELQRDIFKSSRLGVIRAKFIERPGADEEQMKTHVIYAEILGVFAAEQLSKSTHRQCVFVPDINSLGLHFILWSSWSRSSKFCAVNVCTRSLSEFLSAAIVDQPAFADAVNAVSADHTIYSAMRDYGQIYPSGSIERIYRDLSPEDYRRTDFEGFSSWFARQQSALRILVSPPTSP